MTQGIDFTGLSRVEGDRAEYAAAEKARACIIMAHKYACEGLRVESGHPIARRKLVNMRTMIESILDAPACILRLDDMAEEKPKEFFVALPKEWRTGKGNPQEIPASRSPMPNIIGTVSSHSEQTRDEYIARENAKRGFPPGALFEQAKQWAKATYRRIFNAR